MANEWMEVNRLYPKFVAAIDADADCTAGNVLEACLMILVPILAQMSHREVGAYYYDLRHMSESYRRKLPGMDEPAGHA